MKFTILKRLLLGNVVIMLLVIFMGGYVFIKLNQLNEIIREVALVDVNTVKGLENMRTILSSQIEAEKKYLVLNDRDFYNQFEKTGNRFLKSVSQIESLLDIEEEKKKLIETKHIFTAYQTLFEDKVHFMEKYGTNSDEQYTLESNHLINGIDRKIGELIEFEKGDRDEKITQSKLISDRVLRVSTATAALIIITGSLISFLNTHSINHPIKLLKRKTREIATERFIEINDITSPPEIKELADDFNTMSERLRELDAIKTDFLNDVSHELRTPLTAIRSASEMLLDGDAYSAESRELLGIIKEECGRLIETVNSILDLSRMESGMMDYRFEACDILPLLRKAILKLAPIAFKKNIELELITFQGGFPKVVIDQEKIGYVLDNLVGNALKYTPGKGSVVVDVSRKKKFLIVSVSDTGPGIRKEDQEKIFEKFKRINHRVKASKGTGLGLTISRNIISNHGGKIWVESELSKGSTFYFSLPALKPRHFS